MDMARPHADDLEATFSRSPRSLFPGESQAPQDFADGPRGPGTLVRAPRDTSGQPTGIQNPGQQDEHEERILAGIGYDALLSSTAGWGSDMRLESDADRHNQVSTNPDEHGDDQEYAAFADA